VDATLPPPLLFFMGIDRIHGSASAAHGSNGDMLLLLDFKRAITGDRHGAPGSWNATTPFCQWDSVHRSTRGVSWRCSSGAMACQAPWPSTDPDAEPQPQQS